MDNLKVIEKKNQSPNKEWIEKINNIIKKGKLWNEDKLILQKLYYNIKNTEKDKYLFISKENLFSMMNLMEIKNNTTKNNLSIFFNAIENIKIKNTIKLVKNNQKIENNSEDINKKINTQINTQTYNVLKSYGIPEKKVWDFINIFAISVGIANNNGKITKKLAETFDKYQEIKDWWVLWKNLIGNLIIEKNIDNNKIIKFLDEKYITDYNNIIEWKMVNKYSENINILLEKLTKDQFPNLNLTEHILIKTLIKSEKNLKKWTKK